MKLSIITVVYNNLIGLEKTYMSIRKVNESNMYEWIIIDGGSNDGCVDFYESHGDFINYWVSEKDNGVYNAMNKGVTHSKGDYLLFLNSGDVLDEDFQKANWNSFFCGNSDIIYGDLRIIDRDGSVETKHQPESLCLPYFIGDHICHQSVLFSSRLFKDDKYDESYRIAADHEFLLRQVFINNCSIKHIDVPICIYENYGMSSQMYYSYTRPELRKAVSNVLPGGAYWYDTILMRKELDNEDLFEQLQYISNLDSLKKLVAIVVKAIVKLHKLSKAIRK